MRGRWSRRSAALGALALLGVADPAGAQDGDTWRPLSPLLTPRRLLAAAAEGGRLYTFGGCGSPCFNPPSHTSTEEETRVEVYHPATDAWQVRGAIPAIFFGGAAAAPGNGRIYLLGGFLTGGVLLEYDPATDAWRARSPMPTARHGLAAVASGGEIYAFGGSDGQRASGAVEIYDPATDTWRQGAPLPTPRVFLAAAEAGGRIYVVGGSPDCCGGSQTAAVEVYDPAADRWSAAAPLPQARQVSAAAAVGGKVYVLGGFVPGAGVQGETYEYDPSTNTWTERRPMLPPRDQAPAVAIGDLIFVPGGSVACHCRALGDHHEYTPPTPRVDPETRADLAIRITDRVETAGADQTLTYTVRVSNGGPDPVSGARVRVDSPPRLTGVTWSCEEQEQPPGAHCPALRAAQQSPVLEELVDLPEGGAVVFTVTGTVTPADSCPPAPELTATARVFPPIGVTDPNLRNNFSSDTDELEVRVALGVSKRADEPTAGTDDDVAFTIIVDNKGPDIACGARVRDDFPEGLAAVRWTCGSADGGSCGQERGEGNLDDLATLRKGTSVTYRATGRVRRTLLATCPQPIELVNRATVEAPAGVIDPGPPPDRTQEARITLLAKADLVITKGNGVTEVMPGDDVSYTIRVRNRGPDAACGARVLDEFPPELSFSPELSGVNWTCEASAGASCLAEGTGDIDNLVILPRLGSVTYTAEGTVAACDEDGALVNTATVEGPDGVADSVIENNLATDRDTCKELPEPLPVMKLEKRIGGSCSEGEEVLYTLLLMNEGPGTQGDNPGDELIDTLPSQLTLLEASASSGILTVDGNTIAWNGAVGPMAEVTIMLRAEIKAGTLGDSVCNQAFLFADSDGDGVNDDEIPSDDPQRPGAEDPTCFEVCPPGVGGIPALSPLALLLLCALLAALGCLALRSAAP